MGYQHILIASERFHVPIVFEEAEQLHINPTECIDCGACEPACPVSAIHEQSSVPDEWKKSIKFNADFFTDPE
ncbi:MAG TPA: 4Fe-4S binding protein [Ktedonobacteraceae bacterium]|nr:4Fe-4S binding protein [Ktedonobacteraceae bacterium]